MKANLREKINNIYPCDERFGSARLVKFSVTAKEVMHAKFMSSLACKWKEYYDFEPGDYVKLIADGELVMSNTNMEIRTNMEFINMATGDVLIGGLGIGLVAIAIAEKRDVKSITIIEKNSDVIELVWKHLRKHNQFRDKVKIISDDVFKYVTKDKFDVLYFDIWNQVSSTNYEQMKELTKKYLKNKRNRASVILHWRKEDCRKMYRDEERNYSNNFAALTGRMY